MVEFEVCKQVSVYMLVESIKVRTEYVVRINTFFCWN